MFSPSCLFPRLYPDRHCLRQDFLMFFVHMAFPAGGPTAVHLGQRWRASQLQQDCTDNKQEIVTISRSCQENINDMRYKQWALISERPHDFKQPDSSRLVGTVGAGQGNMMKYTEYLCWDKTCSLPPRASQDVLVMDNEAMLWESAGATASSLPPKHGSSVLLQHRGANVSEPQRSLNLTAPKCILCFARFFL